MKWRQDHAPPFFVLGAYIQLTIIFVIKNNEAINIGGKIFPWESIWNISPFPIAYKGG